MAVRAIVLAAGAGTRMNSTLPKVVHEVCGKPMINWVIDALALCNPDQIMVVVGHGVSHVAPLLPEGTETAQQEEQLGTGHATDTALEAMGDLADDDVLLVLPGDTPLLDPETIYHLLTTHRRTGSAASLLTAEVDDPTGYGRILRDGWDKCSGIVEHKDASLTQLQIHEVNAGVYAFEAALLAEALKSLEQDNVQGEFYLTDVIAIIAKHGHQLNALKASPSEIAGVNSLDQLADANRLMRSRINVDLMRIGVRMVDPDRVYIDAGVTVEPGAQLYPDVHLKGETTVAAGAQIGPQVFAVDTRIGEAAAVWYSVVEGAEIGPHATVGPYTRLRPGTVLAERARVGSFVEIKNSVIGEGAKVPHLTYLGDADVGAGANVGAGTITCNYDGYDKNRTVIGENAFIGSDTMLVAPVTIGADAITGAGSVITKDVKPGALAVERSRQREVPDYAERRRRRHEAEEG